jgi:hypothetical protein
MFYDGEFNLNYFLNLENSKPKENSLPFSCKPFKISGLLYVMFLATPIVNRDILLRFNCISIPGLTPLNLTYSPKLNGEYLLFVKLKLNAACNTL